jgi:hypothetical protein
MGLAVLTRPFTTTLLLGLLSVHSEVGAQPRQFTDFSHKDSDYAYLENLLFASNDIEFLGLESIDILGSPYPARKYSLTVPVSVETAEFLGPTTTALYQKRPAKFEIFVVEDRDRGIHDELLKEMYTTWKKKKVISDDYYFDFHMTNQHYVITAVPDSVEVKSFYFVWVNGRTVKIVFKGFENGAKGGWGVMGSFTSNCLRISVDNIQFRAYQYPFRVENNFIKLYEKGFFISPSIHK